MKKIVVPIIILCSVMLSACNDKTSQKLSSNSDFDGTVLEVNADGNMNNSDSVELGVPLSSLSPYEEPAKVAIKEQLGVKVPGEAKITSSSFDKTDSSLIFTWTVKGKNEYTDYYSVSFNNVNIKKGTGDVIYVRSQGVAASMLTEKLTVSAINSFSNMLNTHIPEGSKLVVDISAYDGERSVSFNWWEPKQDMKATVAKYCAGYEQVNSNYSDATLVLLETVEEENLLNKGKYTDNEIQEMRKSAEAFTFSKKIKTSGYARYKIETPGERGNVAFYFNLKNNKYKSAIIYVNAKGKIVGFALSANTATEN